MGRRVVRLLLLRADSVAQMVKERHLKTLTKHWKHLKNGVGPFKEEMQTLLSSLTETIADQAEGRDKHEGDHSAAFTSIPLFFRE